jgi:hypothetical protein
MPYEIGDTEPPHIDVHNELVGQVAALAETMSVQVDLPPIVSLGGTGHVNDHNLFTVAIQKIANEGNPPSPISRPVQPPTQGTDAQQAPASILVKMADGSRATLYILLGNTGSVDTLKLADGVDVPDDVRDKLKAVTVPSDFTGQLKKLLPKDLQTYADIVQVQSDPQNAAQYNVTLNPGVLAGVFIASGATGGSANNTTGVGGGGGAGGVTGLGRSPVYIPGEPNTTSNYVIEVGSSSPGTPGTFTPNFDPLNGMHTIIRDLNQRVLGAAVGGGYGAVYMNAFESAGQGGSGGGTVNLAERFVTNGRGVPGQGNHGGLAPLGGGAGGGAGAPGVELVGGDGVEIATLLGLNTNDQSTMAFINQFTDNGYVAGGGGGFQIGASASSMPGGKGGGGNGWYSGDGQETHTGRDGMGGGGGGTYNTTGLAGGGSGAVYLLGPA